MSSKIKVDTIENVAGSGNVSLGSGHNLVVPGNNSTTGNATVGGTLGVTGTTTAAAVNTSGVITARSGNGTGVSSSSVVSVINSGNSLEWGHANSSGYRCTLGAYSGGGQPFIGFSTEHGSNANTFRTRGLKGHAMSTFDNAGGMHFLAVQSANADNQTPVTTMKIDNEGAVTKPLQPGFCALSGSSQNITSNGVILYGDESGNPAFDNGGDYNPSNGRFTAPVAGVYIFTFSAYKQINQAGGDVTIRINGTASGEARMFNSNSSHETMNGTFIFKLAASDYVDLLNEQTHLHLNTTYSSFSGFLLG